MTEEQVCDLVYQLEAFVREKFECHQYDWFQWTEQDKLTKMMIAMFVEEE